jgi:hypothetical protein
MIACARVMLRLKNACPEFAVHCENCLMKMQGSWSIARRFYAGIARLCSSNNECYCNIVLISHIAQLPTAFLRMLSVTTHRHRSHLMSRESGNMNKIANHRRLPIPADVFCLCFDTGIQYHSLNNNCENISAPAAERMWAICSWTAVWRLGNMRRPGCSRT